MTSGGGRISSGEPSDTSRESEPDPLDVEYYGYKDAPRKQQSHTVSYNDRDAWQRLQKVMAGEHLAYRQPAAEEVEQYQTNLRGRLHKLDLQLRNAVGSPAETEKLTEVALRTREKLDALTRFAIKHSKPSVNPHGLYDVNLAKRNADGQSYIFKDHIRLLRGRPSSFFGQSSLRCELKQFSLRQAPPYSALSYSWGDSEHTTTLSFEGTSKVLPVSSNLVLALAVLLRKCEWLWVDAVCINQAHAAEKSQQVEMMRIIYQRAFAVHVWLGEDLTTGEGSLEPLNDVMSDEAGSRIVLESGATSDSSLERIFRQNFGYLLLRGGRVWWSRLWVVQELVSAQQAFMCFGQHQIHWEEFVSVVANTVEPGDDKMAGRLQAAQTQIKNLHDLRKRIRNSPNTDEILDLMRVTSRSHTSNAKDKVYGVIGLATRRDQAGVRVNYESSQVRVFSELVLHVINTKASLDIMIDQWSRGCGVAYDQSEKSLPSWIPDFSRPMRQRPTPLVQVHAYHASGQRIPAVRCKGSLLKLHVQGLRFDVIEDVMPDCIDGAETGEELDTFRLVTLPSLHAFVEPALRRRIPESDHRRFIDRNDSLWRTLVLDHGSGRTLSAPDEFGEILRILHETAGQDHEDVLERLGSYGKISSDYLQQISEAMYKRALFTTKDGFIGVGSKLAQRGDIIVVPLGASVPFILRKGYIMGTFTLVHECYVHGIMYGELTKCLDRGEVTTEWYTLV